MKMKEILALINEAVKPMIGVKVQDMRDFHDMSNELVKTALADKFPELRVRVWFVDLEKDLMMVNPVFKQTVNLDEDKRYKYFRRGTVKHTEYILMEQYENVGEMTYEQFLVHYEKEEIHRQLKSIREETENKKMEIMKLNTQRAELLEQLSKL